MLEQYTSNGSRHDIRASDQPQPSLALSVCPHSPHYLPSELTSYSARYKGSSEANWWEPTTNEAFMSCSWLLGGILCNVYNDNLNWLDFWFDPLDPPSFHLLLLLLSFQEFNGTIYENPSMFLHVEKYAATGCSSLTLSYIFCSFSVLWKLASSDHRSCESLWDWCDG